ncbi:MAG TPA: hypothetical protein VN678_12970 [Acidobacteriaceae bacterium]|nr:hypothetical protein [Acidobacteriaceae bacterium]
MNEFGQQNPTLFVIALVGMIAGMWLVTGWLISFLSGWAALAEQYRTDRSFPEHKRWMQGAMMRWGCHYNGILTLASDDDGLYMGVTVPIFMGHPRLFIPWRDVKAEEPARWFFIMTQRLRLGPDAVPFRLREPLAYFLLYPGGGGTPPAGALRQPY